MSFVVTTNAGKAFEKPNTGMYTGVLADIVDLGLVTTTYNGQSKTQQMVRFLWFLDVVGADGKQLSVAARYGVNLHEKSNLYKAVKQIINAAPPLTFDLETLLGQVRQLFIVREQTTDANGQVVKDFAGINGIAPAQPGKVATIPADFVRDKNKPVADQAKNKKNRAITQAGPNGQSVQTYATPQAAQQAQTAQMYQQPGQPTQQPAVQTARPQGADVRF